MIVSIAGPSCSGKTSLARVLAARLGAPTFHLDQHYLPDSDHPIVNGHKSFERPHQYDAAALRREVDDALGKHPYIVVEGFLLFLYPGFVGISDRTVFLDIPHWVLAERRRARAAQKASLSDVAGGRVKAADDGWQAHGEAEWNAYGAIQSRTPGIRRVQPGMFGGSDPDSIDAIANTLLREWRIDRVAA